MVELGKGVTMLMKLSIVPFFCAILLASRPAIPPQQPSATLPMIAGAEVPLYPPLARAANLQGDVRVQVTTDGSRVVRAEAREGSRPLAEAAEANARTWRFTTHEPTTFTVTYHYKLVDGLPDPDNPTVVLRFPNEVEISRTPMQLH